MSETSARQFPHMWVDPADDPRETGVDATGEKAVVLEYLDRYRTTLEMKCDGLDAEQLARRMLSGETELPRLYWTEDDRGLDFDGAVAEDEVVADAWQSWRREVANAREVLEQLDLDDHVVHDGRSLEVRDVVVHMLEEYARHVGHANLLRECIDGRTGQ